MWGSTAKLNRIKADLLAPDQYTRGGAMQRLFLWAAKNPKIHAQALPIFRAAAETDKDPWTLGSAAHGIELIAGPEEGRKVWLSLLNHPSADVASKAALAVTDVSYLPVLIDLVERRDEDSIRACAMSTMGRMKHPEALPTMLKFLDNLSLRVSTMESLGDLGDPRAIPYLERYLTDNTDAWAEDNHAPMWTVGDIARRAILKIRPELATQTPPPLTQRIPVSEQPSIAPQSSGYTQAPEGEHGYEGNAVNPYAPYAQARVPTRLPEYIPIFAAITSGPWFAAVLFYQLTTTGTITSGTAETHRLDAISMIPAVIGLVAGIIVFARGRPRNLFETICLYLGCILCGLIVFFFAYEMTH